MSHEFLHIRPFGVVEPAWKRSFFQRGLGLRKRKVREGGGCHEVDEAILERWNVFQWGREANFEGHDKDKSLQAPYFTVEEERMSSLRNHNTYMHSLGKTWVKLT